MKEIIKINDSKDVRVVAEDFAFSSNDMIEDNMYMVSYFVQIKILCFLWVTIKEYSHCFMDYTDSKTINDNNDYQKLCAIELYEHIIKEE